MANDNRLDILIKALKTLGDDYYVQIVVMDDAAETWYPMIRKSQRQDCKD
jgi:hypothetical protein